MRPLLCAVAIAAAALPAARAAASGPASMRPPPGPSTRAAASGPAFYADATDGDDTADGSAAHPWKTIGHGVARLRPGDTLYLHAGTYFETVTLSRGGKPGAPITIRSAPGEVAIVDGGLREFVETPAQAWEPAPGGAPGEFRSVHTFPNLAQASEEDRGVWVVGNFADTMIPLHGYKFDLDLRASNELWNVPNSTPGGGVYLGPGLWFDWQTHRIHVRLAHATLQSQAAFNYAGETDPRKLALAIGIDHCALKLDHASHVRIQDLVLRGSAVHTVDIDASDHVELDGVTIYGGSPALFVHATDHLKLVHSNLRGLAAPWSSRASMKYRGASAYLLTAGSKAPQSHDWELADDEFTDSHDGLVLDSVKTLRFHHNLVDNINDDGLYLALPPRDAVPEDVQIYQNVFRRIYTVFAFAQHHTTANTIGPGVYIFRNLFDLRDRTYGWIAKDATVDAQPLALLAGRLCGDHGNPTWEPMFFYQNTVITAEPAWRSYYGEGMVMGTKGSQRRLFNNAFIQLTGDPGLAFPSTTDDLQVDGNLLWGLDTGPRASADFFAAFRASPTFAASKAVFPPGFGAHDVHGDPAFVALPAHGPLDLRLQPGSAAIDAGVALPTGWPDTLRAADAGKPDIGALPLGAGMVQLGPTATRP